MTRSEDSPQSVETALSSPPRHSGDMNCVEGVTYSDDMSSIINGDNSRQNFSTKNNDALETVVGNEQNKRDDISSKDEVDLHNFNFHRSQSSSFKKQARISKMLERDDSSSSDDEIFLSGNLPQSSSVASTDNAKNTSVPDGRISDIPPQSSPVGKWAQVIEEKGPVEMIPLQVLSEILTPDTISMVKHHLKNTQGNRGSYTAIRPPSFQYELLPRRKRSEKTAKSKSIKLKAKRRVRECIINLPDGEDINTFYLILVRRRLHREVEALFTLVEENDVEPFDGFDKDFQDDDCKSAIIIATEKKDESMIRKLLGFGKSARLDVISNYSVLNIMKLGSCCTFVVGIEVDVGLSIFHAIGANFLEGLKLILAYNACTNLKIETDNNHFQTGMTPILMAAHSNNYRMLSLLYQYGHRLTELTEWVDGIEVAWESSNERKMICLARAQPAYITLTSEVNRMNSMKYCLKELKLMKRFASDEQEFSTFYEDVRAKYEDYMCSLLDLVCSSDELSGLFQLKSRPEDNPSQNIVKFYEGANKGNRWELLHCFELLEQAHDENLVRFVTHQQSQLALSYLRYRSFPLLRVKVVAYAIGLMFPLLSLFYVCAPNSALGGIITLPVVSFNCHMMSDLAFATLVLLQVVLKDVENERLGQPISVLEWIIFIWILGKWVQEFQECIARGFKSYIRDKWNYTDLFMLSLFSGTMIIRIRDAIYNANSPLIYRYQWQPFEPRLIGEGMQAVGYVFLFIRLLGLMRSNRYLGPLQISLAKMLGDVVRFLCLFALVLGAFAFGLSDLYWYYGTTQGSRIFCSDTSSNITGNNGTQNCTRQNVAFMTIGSSMVNLFWALFGIFDRSQMSLQGKHAFTEYIGKVLVAVYHGVAIIVMLNMLIAMMSKSYEDTSENEDTAWKFHRTSVWIRFIRREVVRPPPMNLLPNPWRIRECMRALKMFFWRCRSGERHMIETNRSRGSGRSHDDSVNPSYVCCKIPRERQGMTVTDGEDGTSINMLSQNSSTGRFNPAVISTINTALRENFRERQSKVVLKKLVRRYKLKYLTNK